MQEPEVIPVSDTAGPGKVTPTGEFAGEIFANACIKTAPTFDGAHDALWKYSFTRHSKTGTYYHNRFNLSVNVTNGRCSLVFGTDRDADEVVRGTARGTVSVASDVPPGIDITSRMERDGLRYFRMVLES